MEINVRTVRRLFSFLCIGMFLSVRAAQADEVLIGALFPLTGPAAHLGTGNLMGAEIAVEELNNSGGINGKRLRLVVEDSGSDPRTAVAAFRELVDVDRVSFVLTTLTSVSMAIRPIAEQRNIVVLAESAHPHLTKGGRFIFRNFMTVDAVNEVLIKHLEEKDIHKLAVLHAEEDWGQAALDDLAAHESDKTFKIAAAESFPKDVTDLKPQIIRLLARSPEAIYIVGYGPAVALIYRQLAERQVTLPIVGYLVCGQPDVVNALRGTKLTVTSVDMAMDRNNPVFRKLAEQHEKNNPNRKVDQEIVTGYDGVRVLADSIAAVGANSNKVRDYIVKQSVFSGASGTISFSPDGDSRRPLKTATASQNGCETF